MDIVSFAHWAVCYNSSNYMCQNKLGWRRTACRYIYIRMMQNMVIINLVTLFFAFSTCLFYNLLRNSVIYKRKVWHLYWWILRKQSTKKLNSSTDPWCVNIQCCRAEFIFISYMFHNFWKLFNKKYSVQIYDNKMYTFIINCG